MPRKKKTADETVEEIEQEIEQESVTEPSPDPPPWEPEPSPYKKIGSTETVRKYEPLVVMPKPVGGPERRLYQPNPKTKEWLTKEQALALGFPWKD